MRTSLPVLPARRDGKRGQTISVGPVGALVMVFIWYPVLLAVELVVLVFYVLGWLAVHGCKAVISLCRRRGDDTERLAENPDVPVLAPGRPVELGNPMARPALDPDRPNNTVVSAKVPPVDAERVIELARQAGVTRSEFVRLAVLDALEREDTAPPDGG